MDWLDKNPAVLLKRVKVESKPTDYFPQKEFNLLVDAYICVWQQARWSRLRASPGPASCSDPSHAVVGPRSCLLNLRVRDGLGSEYSLDTKFSCSGLTLEKCGKGQVGSSHTIVQTSLPPQVSNTTDHDLVNPTAEQVRTDVLNYFLRAGTVVAERDIWPVAPPACKLDANTRDCRIRVEVTIQDVNKLRRCAAHFAVYRREGKTWKLDDLTDAGGCTR